MNATELLQLADDYLNTDGIKPCNPEYLIKHLADALRPKQHYYDWINAPEWANWAAADRNGRAYFYADKPVIFGDEDDTMWWYEHGLAVCFSDNFICNDWKESLEARPK